MNLDAFASSGRDLPLFTPGPLTTSAAVKQAMLRDLGSRDHAFRAVVASIRERLLAVAGTSQAEGYEAVPVQGSGTFGIEALLGTALPEDGKLLVICNGAYGERMREIARRLRIAEVVLRHPEDEPASPARVGDALDADPDLTHVAIVHCETTTGLLNPVEEVGREVARRGRRYLVDGMSSFGALPLDLEAAGVEALVSSANKCLEGVPGFSYAIVRREMLERAEGQARSLALDLVAQWQGLERNGQFRFTPPTHALLAFSQALDELEDEGGPEGRLVRYRRNCDVLVQGMAELGFTPYLRAEHQAPIIVSFRLPADERFTFRAFHDALHARGFVIYPGKVSDAECFRIGCIGRLFERDVRQLLSAVGEVTRELGLRGSPA